MLFRRISNEPCILNCSQMVLRLKADTDQNNGEAVFCANRNVSYCQFYVRFQSKKKSTLVSIRILLPSMYISKSRAGFLGMHFLLPPELRAHPTFPVVTTARRGYITPRVDRIKIKFFRHFIP